jgi:hypothetical protein
MNRRVFLSAVTGGLRRAARRRGAAVWLGCTHRGHRSQAPLPAPQPWLDAFREGLRKLGYVEGRRSSLKCAGRQAGQAGASRQKWFRA